MKTQKLLVIVALVCLMAFLNVSTFAQTAQAEPDPTKVFPRLVAETLRAEGYRVFRNGNELTIRGRGIILEVPFTLQDWGEGGIRARLVEPIEEGSGLSPEGVAEEIAKFRDLQRCLGAADFVNNWKYIRCELNVTVPGDLLCKIGVLFEWLFDDLDCILTYLQE